MASDINKKTRVNWRCKSSFDVIRPTRTSKYAWFQWFAVLGLNEFRVGFPTVLPTEGSAVDPNSYVVCQSVVIAAGGDVVGLSIDVVCTASTHQYRYVIVQSMNTTAADKLCIAEACVNVASQYWYIHIRVHTRLFMSVSGPILTCLQARTCLEIWNPCLYDTIRDAILTCARKPT